MTEEHKEKRLNEIKKEIEYLNGKSKEHKENGKEFIKKSIEIKSNGDETNKKIKSVLNDLEKSFSSS